MGVISRYDVLVEDVVFVRWICEYFGVVVIIFFNIYFFYFKFDCILSCYWVFYYRGLNNCR